jgi:DHA2 family multidrug resistance protein
MHPDDQPVLDLPPRRRMSVLATVITTAVVMNAATFTVTTVLPQMQGAFAATQDEIAWTMTFNLLATAIALPLVGWIVPRFGRRAVLLWSISFFTLATFLCGLASSLEAMIAWRIVQGAAGAALLPLGQIILLDVYPRNRHSMVISVFGVANTIGPVLGPLAGGYLAEHYSWRGAFYILVPFGIAATLAAYFVLPDDRQTGNKTQLDWIGFGSLAIAISCLQFILSRGQRVDWFESTEIVVTAWVALLSFYVFLAHSLTTKTPFIDMKLFRDRNYAVGMVLIIAFGMLNFAPMVLLPPLMQTHMGFGDSDVGVVISWRGLGLTAGFLLCMVLNQADERVVIAAGFSAQVLSGLWMMQMDLTTPLFSLCVISVLQGIAVGVVWAPISTVTFRTVPPHKRPEAMAMFHLLRSIATSFFIAVSVAEILRTTGANYARLSESIGSLNKLLAFPGVLGGWDPSTVTGLASLSKEVNRQATMIGYLNTFLVYTIVAVATIPLVLLIRNRSVR